MTMVPYYLLTFLAGLIVLMAMSSPAAASTFDLTVEIQQPEEPVMVRGQTQLPVNITAKSTGPIACTVDSQFVVTLDADQNRPDYDISFVFPGETTFFLDRGAYDEQAGAGWEGVEDSVLVVDFDNETPPDLTNHEIQVVAQFSADDAPFPPCVAPTWEASSTTENVSFNLAYPEETNEEEDTDAEANESGAYPPIIIGLVILMVVGFSRRRQL